MVSKSSGQGEKASGSRDRETETVSEAVAASELRHGAHVLGSGATGYTRSASLHSGGHGEAHPCRSNGGHVHGAPGTPALSHRQPARHPEDRPVYLIDGPRDSQKKHTHTHTHILSIIIILEKTRDSPSYLCCG